MTKKTRGWQDTCERFVAYLDIMGFKDRLYREGHEKVKKMLMSLRPTIKIVEDIAQLSIENYTLKVKLREIEEPNDVDIPEPKIILPVSFSDSIILITSDKSTQSLSDLVKYISVIYCDAILKSIPMKGAIACGQMTADKDNSLFLGQPLIDAFELHQELQFYGVVFHHTTEKCFSELKIKADLDKYHISQYPVPMKSGKVNHYLINWTSILNDSLDSVDKFYNDVSGQPRIYVDNTIEFVREITKK